MSEILFLFIIGLVIVEFLVGEVLKHYNNLWRKRPVPEDLKDVYSEEKYLKYQEYKRETYRFSLITSSLYFILTMVMLFEGFAFADSLIRSAFSDEIIISIVFFGTIGLASDLIFTPFDVYETFVIEQKYGFNTTTVKTYIFDKLKSYMLLLIIGVPVLYLLIWLYHKFGADFWWLAWIVISIFSLLMSLLYSNIIVPLFNKQTPLGEGELKERIGSLVQKTDFNLKKVYIIDGSKRSTRANAYFTGFGSKKRIVLYDTLIKTLSVDEIVAVLAHEIGHYKKKHTLKGLILSIIQTGFILFLFSLIVENRNIYDTIGTPPAFHIGLIIFIILYSPVSFILSLLTNSLSRKYEFQADKYASENTPGSFLISSLKLLTAANMTDLTPNPWYVRVYYSHPPLKERISAINKVKADK